MRLTNVFYLLIGGAFSVARQFFRGAAANVSLHKNSPGYRLILDNIVFPAAKKKQQKT